MAEVSLYPHQFVEMGVEVVNQCHQFAEMGVEEEVIALFV